MKAVRPAIVDAYASILNALEGADARTVMLKMSAAGQLLGVTEAEREVALTLSGAAGSAPVPAAAPAPFEKAPPKRGLKRKAVEPPAFPGTKFLGKYVRVWWDEPYNAFYVGHVVDYQPADNTYKVVYNEGTLDEEHAQEDLEAMPPLSCKIVPAPKSAPTPRGVVQQPMAHPTWDAFLKDKYVRMNRARSLEDISAVSSELDAGVARLKAMLEALGPDSDEDDDEDDKPAEDVGGDDDEAAMLATKQAEELGLDLNETLCEADAPVAASPAAGARTPRDMSIVPTPLQTATPVQPQRETPTTARALAIIETPVDTDGVTPQGDDGAPSEPVAAVFDQVAAVSAQVLDVDARDAPYDDAPLESVLEAAPEDLLTFRAT